MDTKPISLDGISISTSKTLREFLNIYAHLQRSEQIATLKYVTGNMEMFCGLAPDKTKKAQKTFLLKSDEFLFFEAKKIERAMTMNSGYVYQNDVKLTSKQVRELLVELDSEVEKANKLKLRVAAYRRKTIKKLLEIGAVKISSSKTKSNKIKK